MRFQDQFLQKELKEHPEFFQDIIRRWKIEEADFEKKIDSWFSNFNHYDKNLALKVLRNINYYSENNFTNRLESLFLPVKQYLHESDKIKEDLLILVPEDRGDSADKHAYGITKHWGISQKNIITINSLHERISPQSVLVAFNDTHGSGKQFIYEMWNKVKDLKNTIVQLPTLFIISITISEKALDFFNYNLGDQRFFVVPDTPEQSAGDLFTKNEYDNLELLCSKVYPTHKMGFANTALLTAYYFQCPNNSLPIIWADGTNNCVNGKAYPWKPLFAYKAKSKTKKELDKELLDVSEFLTKENNPVFNEDDIALINDTLNKWELDATEIQQNVSNLLAWLRSFPTTAKDLLLKVYSKTNYMTIGRIRSLIKKLGNEVMSDIKACGGSKSDILLVLTGYNKPSVYHHVYDFLKIWNLKVDQAITLEELLKKEYLALNKSLVFFYHTRAGNGNHFRSSVWGKVKDLPSKNNYVLSYIMSEKTITQLKEINNNAPLKYYYSQEISNTLKTELTDHEVEFIKNICINLNLDIPENWLDEFLTAYYFCCPNTTSFLLKENKKDFIPLFKI